MAGAGCVGGVSGWGQGVLEESVVDLIVLASYSSLKWIQLLITVLTNHSTPHTSKGLCQQPLGIPGRVNDLLLGQSN